MTLPSDYAALIAIAPLEELVDIREEILDRIDDLGSVAASHLLKQIKARRKALEDGMEATDGG